MSPTCTLLSIDPAHMYTIQKFSVFKKHLTVYIHVYFYQTACIYRIRNLIAQMLKDLMNNLIQSNIYFKQIKKKKFHNRVNDMICIDLQD